MRDRSPPAQNAWPRPARTTTLQAGSFSSSLSESEIECLNEAIQSYDQYSFGQLTSMSQAAAWQSADENDFISLEAIVHRLGDPNYLLEHLTNSHP